MTYYKVDGRQLVICPANGIWRGPSAVLAQGSSVLNYDLLPPQVLEGQGWKSKIVEDPLPAYDPAIQELADWYEDCGTYIARRWGVTEKEEKDNGNFDGR